MLLFLVLAVNYDRSQILQSYMFLLLPPVHMRSCEGLFPEVHGGHNISYLWDDEIFFDVHQTVYIGSPAVQTTQTQGERSGERSSERSGERSGERSIQYSTVVSNRPQLREFLAQILQTPL